VARFRLGPCPAGDDCLIDSRAFFPVPDGGWVESVTAAGRRWDFDLSSGQLVGPTAGTDLAGEPHLAEGTTGACAGKASGGCVPEARTYRPDLDAEVLVVPRTGAVAYWAYGALSHTPLTLAAPTNGSDLTGFPRFLVSGGPCSGKTVATCHLESLAYVSHGGVTREFVSAYGSLWEFSLPSSAQLSTGKLQSIARFQATACPGPGDCRIRAHAFQPLPDGGFTESFSE
jgi:hypothetical protein